MAELTREDVAARTGVPVEYIDRIIALKLLTPDDGGGLSSGDLRRARFLHNLDKGALPIDAVAIAVGKGDLKFDFFDAPYWERFGGLIAKTLAEISNETGVSLELLQVIRESTGHARPDADDFVREDELGRSLVPRSRRRSR